MITRRNALPTLVLLLASAAVASAQTTKPTHAPPAAKAKPAVDTRTWPELVFIDVGGGYHFNTFDLSETRTEPYFAETKSWTASYSLSNAPMFAIGGGVRAWHNLMAAVTFTSFKDDEPSNITGSVPNPFFFNKPRSFSGTSDSLTHQEQTVHVSGIWRVRVNPKMEVGVGGGPSFISLQQDFVKDVEFTEQYPYDTATFSRAVTEHVKKSFVGFHVGGDLAWFFTHNIGVSGTVRYSHANADITTPANNAISMKLGGVETTVGVRLSFGGRPIAKVGHTAGGAPRTTVIEHTSKSSDAPRRTAVTIGATPVFVKRGAPTPLVTLPAGTRLTVLSTSDGWAMVEFDDARWGRRVGYLEERLVKMTDSK
jgi:hypothetical protein